MTSLSAFDNMTGMVAKPRETVRLRSLLNRLKKTHTGDIIAFDDKTGRYILGDDELDVALEAKKKYPRSVFTVCRVGYPAVHKFRRR